MTALGNVPLPTGRHVEFRDWDSVAVAHMPFCGGMGSGMCPRCTPDEYARVFAKHRADVAA